MLDYIDWAEPLISAQQSLTKAMNVLSMVLPGGLGTNQLLDAAEREMLRAHRQIARALATIKQE